MKTALFPACFCVIGLLLAGCDGRPTTSAVPSASAAPAPTPETKPVATNDNKPAAAPAGKVEKSDEDWRKQLTDEQYFVARKHGTEAPFSSPLDHEFVPGEYHCAACGALLFTSDTKFDSHCGWPAFYKSFTKETVGETVDRSHGMVRTEVHCNNCGAHLGHVFDDSPQTPTGQRYCINGVVLKFVPRDPAAK